MNDKDDTQNSAGVAEGDDNKQPVGEMIDRAARKALKAKAKKEAKTKSQDEIDFALKQGRFAKEQKAKRKKQMKIGGALIGALLLGFLVKSLFTPYKGGVTYGICKVFLETQVQFPKHLRHTGMKDFGDSVRIWYTRIDAFGEDRMETMRCYYKYDEELGSSIVDKVTIDRREVDPRKVESFNRSLPVVLKNLPDLTYPKPLEGNNLRDLQIDTDSMRKPIF